MLKRIRAARGNENGFTLTELLITIVILGVLAGIVVFAVAQFTDDGNEAACETGARAVSSAAAAFVAREGRLPATIAEIVTEGYLQAAPSNPEYAIVYAAGTGLATCDLTP